MSDFKEAQEGAKQQALRQLMQTADSDTGWLSDMPKVSAEEEDFPTTVFILAEESHAIGSIDVAQAINEVWEIFETFYDSTYKAQTSLLQKQMKDLLEELRDLSFVNGELSRKNESLKAEAWEQGTTHAWNEGIRRQNPEVADAIEDDFLPYSVRKNNPHKGGHR